MWTWTIAGTTYNLDDGTTAYFLGYDGAGMVPFHRFSERGPQQDGSTDRGFRLDPRILLLSIAVSADSWPEYYQKLATLIQAFKPLNIPGKVRREAYGVVREIEGFVVDGLSFGSKQREGLIHREVVAIKCDDPAWYDPEARAVTFALGAEGGGTPVPSPVPTPVGGDALNAIRVISYTGSLPAYPKLIRITGPIVDPVIVNLSIGEKLDFTGVTIDAGHYYDIDLSYLNKSVVDQDGENRYHELTPDSSLSTWRLEASPVVPDGANQIQVTGSGVSAATRVDISYFDRHVSAF